MRRSLVAAVVAAALLPSLALAQLGTPVGSYQFAGCDPFFCGHLTVTVTTDPTAFAPYLAGGHGTLTATPAWFAAGNTANVQGAYYALPIPDIYTEDWFDGDPFFTTLDPSTHTGAFIGGSEPIGLRWAAPTVPGATLAYYGQSDPSGMDLGYRFLTLAPVTTSTPEPATFALLGGGLLALGFAARRRRSRA